MTEHIEEIFTILGECGDDCEEAVKAALQSLTSVVRKMNQTLLELASQNSLGFELSVKMSDRANEYFIRLLRLLLVSDAIASYFVFDLRGFEFLLDTIGVGSESEGNIKRFGEASAEFEVVESSEARGVMQQVAQQDLKTAV